MCKTVAQPMKCSMETSGPRGTQRKHVGTHPATADSCPGHFWRKPKGKRPDNHCWLLREWEGSELSLDIFVVWGQLRLPAGPAESQLLFASLRQEGNAISFQDALPMSSDQTTAAAGFAALAGLQIG